MHNTKHREMKNEKRKTKKTESDLTENDGDKFYYVIRYLASLSITNRQK